MPLDYKFITIEDFKYNVDIKNIYISTKGAVSFFLMLDYQRFLTV